MNLKILVCGGRDYVDNKCVNRVLNYVHKNLGVRCIIQGGARGADYLASLWAQEAAVACQAFPADWNRYGKRAGFLRNAQMLSEGKPDQVIAFPGGRGTADMIRQAEAAGFEVWKVPG